jgi:hypothetical protein
MSELIHLELTPQQLDAVATALGHRPYIEAAPVLDAIAKQVQTHNEKQAPQGLSSEQGATLPLP